MGKYVAILRGINVSGQKKIRMAELRDELAVLGLKNLSTYIQSGNILFETEVTDELELAQRISENIATNYGFDVPVIVLTIEDLKGRISDSPYRAFEELNSSKLYVTFLQTKPDKDRLRELNALDYSPDEITVSGKTVYVHCPGGYGDTIFSNNFIESKLKVTATTRNWKTTNKLVELSSD